MANNDFDYMFRNNIGNINSIPKNTRRSTLKYSVKWNWAEMFTLLAGAWLIMIGLGMAHASNPSVPVIGYLPILVISLGLSWVVSRFTGGSK